MTFNVAGTRLAILLTILAASAGLLSSCAAGAAEQGSANGSAPTSPTSVASVSPGAAPADPAPTDPVPAAAWEALLAPDGEYAAAASYAAVIEEFGPAEPYVSIKAAEEQHIVALTRQLERLGVTVPANPWLGQVAPPVDLTAAARSWADGEVANVALYDQLMTAASSDAALTRVFTNLRRASLERHLPLFRAAAENGGTLSADQMRPFAH